MKKWITAIIAIAGAITLACGIGLKVKKNTAVSIIGGADGPTSVFIAGKIGTDSTLPLIIGIILLFTAMGAVLFFTAKK